MRVALATAHALPALDQDNQPLAAALRARGAQAEILPWDDDVDWSGFDMVVVRSTWDYTWRREEFLAWADRVGALTSLWNRPEVLRWNTHKGYLIELEERGAPIVPTAWLGQGDRVDLASLLASRGWDDAVAKPAVGAGARGLVRIRPGDDPDQAQLHLDALLAAHDVMVQPFLPGISTHGETSLVFLDGAFSHAVRKRPAPGEIRIHVEHGGTYTAVAADPDWLALASWIVEATGHDLLYARVDLIPDELGNPQLAELEATEPSLYLTHVPEAADRLAAIIVDRVSSG